MVNKAHGLDRLRIVQGDGERTLIGTHFTAALVTVLKNVVGAGVAEHIDARVARDLLRAVAPENNLALEIENTDANLQAVEDVTVNVGVLESCHGARPNARCLFIGSAATLLQRWKLLVRESTRTRQKSFGWLGITLYFLIV